jgi:hypothetical protein
MSERNVRQVMADKETAKRLFAQMSTEERWAYWAEEVELGELFERNIPGYVRRHVADLVNLWVTNPE